MLTRWTLENFKPIRERLDLELKPLTVLAGLNSSGKSSFLQSILLISQTLAHQKLDEPLVLNGPLVRLGTFGDICNDRTPEQRLDIGFTLDARPPERSPFMMDMQLEAYPSEEGNSGLQATRAELKSAKLSYLSIELGIRRESQITKSMGVPPEPSEAVSSPDSYYVQIARSEKFYPTQLRHFVPMIPVRLLQDELSQSSAVRLRRGADYVVATFGSGIRYLGPLRADPYAIQSYSLSGLADDVGPRGEYAAAVYAVVRRQEIRFWNPHVLAVETASFEEAMDLWLRYLGIADHVGTREAAVPGVSWVVRSSSNSREHSLQAVGVGVSQVLPILVSGLLSPEGTIHIMEQPELHLHERPQARLADFFYGLTRVGKQILVETHSAVLINQLRYLMVKHGQEARDAIAVYFVERDEQGDARFEPIRIGKGGAVENWPDGFFDESFRQEDRITAEGLRARGKPKRA